MYEVIWESIDHCEQEAFEGGAFEEALNVLQTVASAKGDNIGWIQISLVEG